MMLSGLMKTSARRSTVSVLFKDDISLKISMSNVYKFFSTGLEFGPEELKLITTVIIINWNFVINGLEQTLKSN